MRYIAILFLLPSYIDAADMTELNKHIYRKWTEKWDCLATDIREGTCGIIVRKI